MTTYPYGCTFYEQEWRWRRGAPVTRPSLCPDAIALRRRVSAASYRMPVVQAEFLRRIGREDLLHLAANPTPEQEADLDRAARAYEAHFAPRPTCRSEKIEI